MGAKSKTKVKRSWLSEGVIIAATPVAAYLLAFLYEVGFAGAFDIPRGFITLNLANVFVAAGAFLSLVPVLYFLTQLAVAITDRYGHRLIYGPILRLFPPIAILAVYIHIFGAQWREWVGVLIGVCFLAAIEFGFPLIAQRRKKGYTRKLLAQERVEGGIDGPRGLGARRTESKLRLILWCVILPAMFAHGAGRGAALKQRDFLVFAKPIEMVVVRIYPDKMVCAPLHRRTKTVERSFMLLKPAGGDGLILLLEEVGPLRLRKNGWSQESVQEND